MLEVKRAHDKYTASYPNQSLRRDELGAARNAYSEQSVDDGREGNTHFFVSDRSSSRRI